MVDVISTLDYLGPHDAEARGKPYEIIYMPPEGFPRQNYDTDTRETSIKDIRGREHTLSLAKNGFEVLHIDSKLSYEDFYDSEKVQAVYYQQVAKGVKKLLGAKRVQIFEHVVRKRDAQFPIATGEEYDYNQPTTRTHIDMTQDWALAQAEHMNDRKGISLPSTDFQYVNIWKPLRGPIRDWPLALCDTSTLDSSDVVATDMVYSNSVVENILIRYNAEQDWYYLSDQTDSEAWVFLQADSRTQDWRGVPHSGFALPDGNATQLRESIEVRAIAYF